MLWRTETDSSLHVILSRMHRHLKHSFILLIAVALSGCGFTLRGSFDFSSTQQNIYLESVNDESDIYRELRLALISNDITILDNPGSDAYRLDIGSENSEERVLSVNSNARAGEYELTLSVPVQLRSQSAVVFGPETLAIEKVYLADPDSAVAKAEERELLEDEMRRELVNQILRRLQNLAL